MIRLYFIPHLAQGLLIGMIAVGACIVFSSPAFADNVVLWVCHGPDGGSLSQVPLISSDFGDGVDKLYGGGCASPSSANTPAGVEATFTAPDPIGDSVAGYRVFVPTGTKLTSVMLERATGGFGGVPQAGDPLGYSASTDDGVLESANIDDASDLSLTGSTTFAPASGDWVYLGVSCAAVPGVNCAVPASGTVGVDISAIALGVSDPDPPAAAVGGVESPVTGTLPLMISATDDGLGLASATVSIDGQPVTTVDFGGSNCAPLSTVDGVINLPFGADCPSSVSDIPANVDTTSIPDGPHQLSVTVSDIAGNTTNVINQTIDVLNHPAQGESTAEISVGNGGAGNGGVSASATASSATGGAAGVEAASALSGRSPVCVSPRLSAALASRPLRVSLHNVAVLWSKTRYLFTGRLTCIVNRRRISAADTTQVGIRSFVGKLIVPRTGAAVYASGRFRVLLHPVSDRTIEFYFGTGSARTVVEIPVIVTPNRNSRGWR